MKALISPTELVYRVCSIEIDEDTGVKFQRTEPIPNAGRVAQVEQDENVFEVAAPLFWVSCQDDCVAGVFYYDKETGSIEKINHTVA